MFLQPGSSIAHTLACFAGHLAYTVVNWVYGRVVSKFRS